MLNIIKKERAHYLNIIENSNNKLVMRTANAQLQRMNRLHRKFNSLTKS